MVLVPHTDVQRRVLDLVEPGAAVAVALVGASGRSLREPVQARTDLPPFDCSAMDGYAVLAADLGSLPAALEVIDVSSCGHPAAGSVRPGTAIRILTGAVVPDGADAVVPVELTDGGNDVVVVQRQVEPGANIRRRGEVASVGDVLVAAGSRLNAAAVAVAAEAGVAELVVGPRPRVAVVSTGDELVGPDEVLAPGQIRDSNIVLVGELARAAGAAVTAEHLPDDAPLIRQRLIELAASHDLVLTTGGVSMGAEFDPLRAALADHPVEFVQAAVKPAKPLAFGRIGDAVYLGLPGNPVSALVSFALFVRPVLRRFAGRVPELPVTVKGVLAERVTLAPGPRLNLLPVRSDDRGEWVTNRYAGSHALAATADAAAFAVLPAAGGEWEPGSVVELLPVWEA